MEDNSTNSSISNFVENNFGLIKKIETFSIVLFLVGFTCYKLKLPSSDFILITGCVLSAIIFFLKVFKMFELDDSESFEPYNKLGSYMFVAFFYKLYYFALSISMISVIGFVIGLKTLNSLFFVGVLSLVTILLLTLCAKMRDKSKIYDLYFYLRLLGCLGFLVYFAINR